MMLQGSQNRALDRPRGIALAEFAPAGLQDADTHLDTVGAQLPALDLEIPHDSDAWNLRLASESTHADGHLAGQALAIEATFSREYQIGGGDIGCEIACGRDHLEAAPQFGPEERNESGPHAATGSRSGYRCHVDPDIVSDARGKVGKTCLQAFDIARGRALLGTKPAGRSLGAEQRCIDIARADDRDRRSGLCRSDDAIEVDQRAATGG